MKVSKKTLLLTSKLLILSFLLTLFTNNIQYIKAADNPTPKTQVLLIQDNLPWNSDANQILLKQLNLPYTKVSAATAKNLNFDDYRLIFVADDQNAAFYSDLSKIRTKLEQFAIKGGSILYGICDGGWAAGTSELLIPGDVQLQPMAYRNYNYIKDHNHPVVTGVLTHNSTALENKDLYSNYCSHRVLNKSTLPVDANIILQASDSEPTLVEYKIGKGSFIASTLTWEHDYINHTGNDSYGTFARKSYDDLILYAYNQYKDPSSSEDNQQGNSSTNNQNKDDTPTVTNGNFKYSTVDFSVDGIDGFKFTRSYDSNQNDSGILGSKWTADFGIKLQKISERRFRATFADSHTEDFIHGDDGVWFGSKTYNSIEYTDGNRFYFQYPSGASYEFDGNCNLISRTNNSGYKINYSYSNGKLVKISDSLGKNITYTYTGENLVEVKTMDDSVWKYVYNEKNQLLQIIDPLSNIKVTNTYDNYGRVIEQQYADGSVNKYSYEDKKTTYTDKNGEIITYNKNDDGNVIKKDSKRGSELYSYNNSGKITSYTDKNGNEYTYEYDDKNNLVKETDAAGNPIELTYNSFNKIGQIKRADGSIYKYDYDSDGNVIKVTDPMQRTITMEYNNRNQLIKKILPNGSEYKYVYYDNGNLQKELNAEGNATKTYEYDVLNRVTSTTDANGNKTFYEYDINGNVTKIKFNDGSELNYSYDSNNNLISSVDETGIKAIYKYNVIDKIAQKILSDNTTNKYTYNSMGNINSITNPDGSIVTFSYNDLNKIATITDEKNNTIKYSYDNNGNVLSITDKDSKVTKYIYDSLNRITEKIDSNGKSTKFEYRFDGKITKITDSYGYSTEYSYDLSGNIISVKYPDNSEEVIQYNENGLLSKKTKTNNYFSSDISYEYNNLNNIIKITDNGCTSNAEYNSNGNLITVTDSNGNTMKYSYDCRNRLISVDSSINGILNITYTGNNKVKSLTDKDGNSILAQYDSNSNLIGLKENNGMNISYVFNELNELSEIHNYSNLNSNDKIKFLELNTKLKFENSALLDNKVNPLKQLSVFYYDVNGNLLSKDFESNSSSKDIYDTLTNLNSNFSLNAKKNKNKTDLVIDKIMQNNYLSQDVNGYVKVYIHNDADTVTSNNKSTINY